MPQKTRFTFNKSSREKEKETDNTKKKREERIYVPLTLFYVKDIIREFANHKHFPDSMLSVFAMASVAIASPFYPIAMLIPLLVILFVLARLHPLAGLMALLFFTFPMYIYQAPLLAWLYVFFVTAALFLGYRHYRTITLIYALISLPFSYLGYAIEIPTFIMSVLFIGFKRGSLAVIATLLLVPIISGLSGIHSTAPIVYNQTAFRSYLYSDPAFQLLTPSSPPTTLGTFPAAASSALAGFFSFNTIGYLSDALYLSLLAIASNIEVIVLQLVVWLAVVLAISSHIIKSRSGYKGTDSSLYGLAILLTYVSLSYAANAQFSLLVLSGFIIAPLLIFVLETNDIEIVRALSVMKQDFLGKFGEAFEDLTSGTNETLDDVGDYDQTKKELTEAILAPIEHREIAGAYNIKPAKGILLFGPPGTGKTLLMRALSNEIRARFFYVKTSSLLSPYAGRSAQMLSKIFDTVKKNKPAVLFFDEIDGLVSRREMQESDISRQLISTLLSEMDGFQKVEGIVIVGSTNAPNLLDPSVLRPGRFDKIIYMPLPDRNARLEIFRHYSRRYPMVSGMDLAKLADITQRFSGADIANVCAETARQVAEVAIKRKRVLKIDSDDLAKVIKATKPSTSLSRLSEYEKFKLDYERRMYAEAKVEREERVSIDDVIGLEDAKKALYEAIEIPVLHLGLVKEYDVKNISGVLLFGPPGTGKSMLMKAVANEVGEYKMISISGTDLVNQGVDKAVATIKEIFDRAKENAPSIIFIDEIDSLVPSREKTNQADVQITAEFLREFDSVKETPGVVLVGSTNRPDAIDTAMIRPGRFDKLIFTAPPDKEARSKLFRVNLVKAPLSDDLDFEGLAMITQGYTGADIANICREAKMNALERKIETSAEKRITMKEVEDIIKDTKPSAPGLVLGRYLTFLSMHGRR